MKTAGLAIASAILFVLGEADHHTYIAFLFYFGASVMFFVEKSP